MTLRGVKKSFPLGEGGQLEVLDVEHLALPAASCTVLHGPQRLRARRRCSTSSPGVSVPTAGTIVVDDTEIFALSRGRGAIASGREHVGYVFQTFNLLAAFSALENVMLAMMFAARRSAAGITGAQARELLSRLGLGRAPRLTQPAQLSRGRAAARGHRARARERSPADPRRRACASLDARTARAVLAAFLGRVPGRTARPCSSSRTTTPCSAAADRVLDIAEVNRAVDRLARWAADP